jgi:regulator of sigma E protease
VKSSAQLSSLTEANKGTEVEIVYQRNGARAETTATLRANNDENQGFLGVSAQVDESYRSTWSAPIVGVGLTAQLSWETLKGIGGMAANFFGGLVEKLNPDEEVREQADEKIAAAGQNVAGPVGLIGVVLPRLLQSGVEYIVLITAVISLSLAVLNSLPIPGLDGGRWALIAVYRALRRPLTKEREEQIVGYGMLFLLAIFVLITVADVGKFFN